MQAFEVSGFAVRWVSGNVLKFCRTDSRTVAGHLAFFANKYNNMKLSGQLSGAVRRVANARCLSGGVSLGRARPDTRTDTRFLEDSK